MTCVQTCQAGAAQGQVAASPSWPSWPCARRPTTTVEGRHVVTPGAQSVTARTRARTHIVGAACGHTHIQDDDSGHVHHQATLHTTWPCSSFTRPAHWQATPPHGRPALAAQHPIARTWAWTARASPSGPCVAGELRQRMRPGIIIVECPNPAQVIRGHYPTARTDGASAAHGAH